MTALEGVLFLMSCLFMLQCLRCTYLAQSLWRAKLKWKSSSTWICFLWPTLLHLSFDAGKLASEVRLWLLYIELTLLLSCYFFYAVDCWIFQ